MLTRTTSAVLTRRTTSLTLHVRGRSTSIQPKLKLANRLKPPFPCEILDAIVGHMLSSYSCPKTRFLAIRPLIQASKMLRKISLRLYFRDILVDTWLLFTQVWDYLSIENEVFGGPNSFAWVKSVICPSHIIASSLIMNLGSFTNLHSLELSFASEGVSTQDTVIHRLLDSFTRSATRMTLEKLTFTEIPRIDTKLLHSLSGTFPQLQSLELGSTKRIEFDCCIVCMEDSLECIRHSPIPDYYANAEKFAASLSRSLAAMTKLKSLYLGILLSDAHILEEHFTHCDLDKGARGVVASLPSCNVCGEFREGTERREWSVSLALAQALPGLITVRWDTLFPPLACEGLESDEDGFYFTLEGDLVQVPSTVTFFIHRRSDSGDVETVTPVHF